MLFLAEPAEYALFFSNHPYLHQLVKIHDNSDGLKKLMPPGLGPPEISILVSFFGQFPYLLAMFLLRLRDLGYLVENGGLTWKG